LIANTLFFFLQGLGVQRHFDEQIVYYGQQVIINLVSCRLIEANFMHGSSKICILYHKAGVYEPYKQLLLKPGKVGSQVVVCIN